MVVRERRVSLRCAILHASATYVSPGIMEEICPFIRPWNCCAVKFAKPSNGTAIRLLYQKGILAHDVSLSKL